MIAKGDRQQEKLREFPNEVTKKTEALAEEWTKAIEMAKVLEEAARNGMQLTRQHYEETEREKMALNKV